MIILEKRIYGIVYLAICQVDQKCYVGQTTHRYPLRYFQDHLDRAKRGKNKLLYRAIRKHGESSFTFSVIWYAFDKIALDLAEDELIKTFNSMAPYGYNLKTGGASGLHVASTKLKMSDLAKAARADLELEARRRATQKLTLARADVRIKRGEASRLALSQPETKAKKRANMLALHASLDFQERHRQGIKLVVSQPDVKAKHLAAIKLAFARPECKARRSKASLGLSWINNGMTNRRIRGVLPLGWSYGIIRRKTEIAKVSL